MKYIDCCGVFQGGGTKAAAYAGAYHEVYKAGIRFHAVAGTSAGSIVAALVGAGACPIFIEQALQELDFQSLLRPPQKHGKPTGKLINRLGILFSVVGFGKVEVFGKILACGGLYSSHGLEEWLETKLLELLRKVKPHISSPVRFSELLMPTIVVAADLATGKARIMSQEETPNESVAFAVRASCSIPGFFQPIVEGDNRLVDGGIVSNLPTFVFARNGRRPPRRILAFRMIADREPHANWTLQELSLRLIDTVISGAADVQLKLQDNIEAIVINIGGASTVDFTMSKKTREALHLKGRDAAQTFITEGGLSRLRSKFPFDIRDKDEAYLAISRQIEACERVIISERDTAWYWQLFPTILHWRLKRVTVIVLLQPVAGDEREKAREIWRRKNLAGLGVSVKIVEDIPFRSFVFCRDGKSADSALVYSTDGGSHAPLATLYRGAAHQSAVSLIRERLEALAGYMTDSGYIPKLTRLPLGKLCHALQTGVRQYSNDKVTVTVEAVPLSGVRCITKLVRLYKYEQMLFLIEDLRSFGLDLYEPCCVQLEDGTLSIMGPPVFEIHGKTITGIEGNTRTYYARRHGLETIRAVVVREVDEPPPGDGVNVDEVTLIEQYLPPEERMPGFEYERFRRIEGACHPLHMQQEETI